MTETVMTLAQLRRRAGLTQQELADRMAVSQQTVARFEMSPAGTMHVETLARYVRAVGGTLRIRAEFPDEMVAVL